MKLFISISIVIILAGCDIFETRDAEKPNQSRSNYETATLPEILIQNLKNSFADKDAVNYQNCFVSGFSDKEFQFIPSSTALSVYQNLWTTWNVDDEMQYFNALKSRVPEGVPITVTLSEQPESFVSFGDSVKYTSAYSINIPDQDPSVYEGNAEFSLIRDSRSVWVIYLWKDNAIGDSPSWSDLKGSVY